MTIHIPEILLKMSIKFELFLSYQKIDTFLGQGILDIKKQHRKKYEEEFSLRKLLHKLLFRNRYSRKLTKVHLETPSAKYILFHFFLLGVKNSASGPENGVISRDYNEYSKMKLCAFHL